MTLRNRSYEKMEEEFDTKMRRAIESALDQLVSLKKKDDPKARKHEQDVLNGLSRMMKSDPMKFMYSMLEILGVRGKYKSKKYGKK